MQSLAFRLGLDMFTWLMVVWIRVGLNLGLIAFSSTTPTNQVEKNFLTMIGTIPVFCAQFSQTMVKYFAQLQWYNCLH